VNILAIETSCDETAAAVVADGRQVRSNVVASQIALHQAHGGVVPELAARGHVTAIIPVVETALAEAGIDRAGIDVVAVTAGPGLAGALLVGVNVAKALAYALGRPLVTVNHLEAHVAANWLVLPREGHDALVEPPPAPPELPAVCLLVSGGHTELILVEAIGRYRPLGQTRDDAAGEAFDKGARLLGLGYPGGPAIQRAAAGGDPTRFPLPRAWLAEADPTRPARGGEFDFSFSGLKTALLRLTEPYRLPAAVAPFAAHRPPAFAPDLPVADLAASFQAAVAEVLAVKTARAARATGARSVLLAGGVAANAALRARVAAEVARLAAETGDDPIPVRSPAPALCTDNAAMIAGAAFHALRRGEQAGWEADVPPRLPLGTRP
jgi:N6-L-threonylcarbamoyladenine synthase